MKRYLLIGVSILVGLVLVVVLVGALLPVRHRTSRIVQLRATPREVFALVSTVEGYPAWRRGVDRVELLDSMAGRERFREHGSDGVILYEVIERVPGERFVVRIADSTLPFGGRWTHRVSGAGTGATLRISEDGEVYNPLFRFVSRFVMGHASTVERYLSDVGSRLGQVGAITP